VVVQFPEQRKKGKLPRIGGRRLAPTPARSAGPLRFRVGRQGCGRQAVDISKNSSADVLINAVDAALEDREVVFDGIGCRATPMTMFSRRSIASFLKALNSVLTGPQLEDLVKRLNLTRNVPGKGRTADKVDSVAAEWELSVLYGLTLLGRVSYEPKIGKKKPDILFKLDSDDDIKFIADVTLVSDADLEHSNPIFELTQLVAAEARKLGGISGSFSFAPESTAGVFGASKVQLSIPHKRDLPAFVRDHIIPHLRLIAQRPSETRVFLIKSAQYKLMLTYMPGQRFSYAKYRSYRSVTRIDKNPLFHALEAKRKQLQDTYYEGCRGIIVCDGGCEIITKQSPRWGSYSKEQILRKFLRNTQSISFIVLLWVEELGDAHVNPRPHRVNVDIMVNPHARYPVPAQLVELLKNLPKFWPQPVQTGERTRLQLEGYGPKNELQNWGRRLGGFRMGRGRSSLTFRMSARELMEILSGRRSHQIFEEEAGFATASRGNGPMNPFESALRHGLTISAVRIERNSDLDDDWIEFRMEGPDPALTPFQVARQGDDGADAEQLQANAVDKLDPGDDEPGATADDDE
jgi:hypothetical protein